MNRPPLTKIAQQAVSRACRAHGRAIDATVGNGHDTLMLARCVAPDGRVVGFDIQPSALDHTRQRLNAAGLEQHVELINAGHEHMRDLLGDGWVGNTDIVMFNLGYLPGGDKSIITQPDTTTSALAQSLDMLRPGGLLSLMLYHATPRWTAVADAVPRTPRRRGRDCRRHAMDRGFKRRRDRDLAIARPLVVSGAACSAIDGLSRRDLTGR